MRQKAGFVADPSQGDQVMQQFLFLVYVITFLLIVLRWKNVVRAVTREKFLLLLVGLAVLSIIWSAEPMITLRRSVSLLGTTLVGVYLATRYSLKEQLWLLAGTLGIAAVLSLLFSLAVPSYAIHQGGPHSGAWRGIYVHKNAMGQPMALGLLVFALLSIWSEKYRWVAWAGFGLSAFLILRSTSVTPLISSLTILAILPIYMVWRWRYPLNVPLFIMALLVGAIVAILLLTNLETVLGAAGRDLTFTGRSELWSVVIEMIQKRPWLGYGYSGFWVGWQGESAYIWQVIPWTPSFAHNGYLDLGLGLGLVGITVFVMGFLTSFLRAFTWAYATKTAEGLFPLAYLTFMLPYNISDSVILQQTNIFWVVYVSTVLSMVVQRRNRVA